LSLFVKAKAKAEVTLALDGRFDTKPHVERKVVTVGPTWTEMTFDFTPPKALTGGLELFVTVPAGSEVSVDAVRFRPK
jgi:hypothetical protein